MMYRGAYILLIGLAGCDGADGPEPKEPDRQDAAFLPKDGGGSGVDASLPPTDAEAPPDGGRGRIDPRLLPGTGVETFLALEDDALLRWEAGPQGGFHVFAAARVASEVLEPLSDRDREDVLHAYTLSDADGAVVARTVRAGRWVREAAGYEARSILLVLAAGLSPYRVSEGPLLYTVWLELPGGAAFESSIVVRTACCD